MTRSALVLVFLWALAVPAAADAVPTWSPPFGLSSRAQNARQPALDVDPAGHAVAVWSLEDDVAGVQPSVVQAAIRPAGGDFAGRQALSVGAQDARFPQVAIDAGGTAVAVWLRFPSPVVQAAIRPANGTFGPPRDISLPGQDASEPQVAIDAAGNAVAIWTRSDGASRIVQAASRPAGGEFGPVQDLSAPGQDAASPQLAIDDSGVATAVWTRLNGANRIVQAASRPARGVFTPPQDISAPGTNSFVPQVAVDRAGNAIAVWTRFDGRIAVAQAAFRPAGGAFAPPQDLSAPEPHIGPPQVAMNANGDSTVVWSRTREDTDIVQAASRPAGGTFGAPEILSDAPLVGDAPQVAVDNAGNATVVWLIRDRWIIQAAGRPAGGLFGRPEDVATSSQLALSPQVAVDSAGNATSVWTRSNRSSLIVGSATRAPVGAGSEPPPLLALQRLALAPRRFTRTRRATISYVLSRPANVAVRVQAVLAGRRSGASCVKPTRRLRREPACTRYLTRAVIRNAYDSGGTKTLVLRARVGGRTLAAGRYRLRVTAGAPGVLTTSGPQMIGFDIVRR